MTKASTLLVALIATAFTFTSTVQIMVA